MIVVDMCSKMLVQYIYIIIIMANNITEEGGRQAREAGRNASADWVRKSTQPANQPNEQQQHINSICSVHFDFIRRVNVCGSAKSMQ